MSRCSLIIVVALGLCTGCVPPKLMEADAGTSGPGTSDTSEPVPFAPVAEVVRGSCSQTTSCHGSTSVTNFVVQGDGEATDEQVYAALDGATAADGMQLITPGDPDQSAMYVRLIETGPRKMPPTETLTEEQIEAVRAWIADGAHYE